MATKCVSDKIKDSWREKERAGLAFNARHDLKTLKPSDSGRMSLTQFPVYHDVIDGADFDRERLAEAFVPLSDFQSSGLGRVNYCNFIEEFFPDARRFGKKNGEMSGWTVAEILRGCRHTSYRHGVCNSGGEHVAFGSDCGDASCFSYQDKDNARAKDVSMKDIFDAYHGVDFSLGFTSHVFTTSLYVRELLTKKFLCGAPVEADLCRLADRVIQEVFLTVVDDATGRSRVSGISHEAVQNFSSGKDIPKDKSRGAVFLERGFAWHVQGFLLNIGMRKDGSLFRLSHIGREFSQLELKQYRLSAGMLWRDALQKYLGVKFPAEALNSEGVLNVHFNFGQDISMRAGGLANRLIYDNRSAHRMVSSLIFKGGLYREMRRLRSHDVVGFERAKTYLRCILNIPDSSGVVLSQFKKRSMWFGLFAASQKKKFFKRIDVVFKSRKERIKEMYALRKIKCPKHHEGEIIIEMEENQFGVVVPARYSYSSLIDFFKDVFVILKGGYARLERYKERDCAPDLGS